jgi:hypothetical protein
MLGSYPRMNIRGKRSFNTNCGACLTIFVVLLISLVIVNGFFKVIDRTQPQVIVNDIPTAALTLALQKSKFQFALMINHKTEGVMLYNRYSNYYDIIVTVTDYSVDYDPVTNNYTGITKDIWTGQVSNCRNTNYINKTWEPYFVDSAFNGNAKILDHESYSHLNDLYLCFTTPDPDKFEMRDWEEVGVGSRRNYVVKIFPCNSAKNPNCFSGFDPHNAEIS